MDSRAIVSSIITADGVSCICHCGLTMSSGTLMSNAALILPFLSATLADLAVMTISFRGSMTSGIPLESPARISSSSSGKAMEAVSCMPFMNGLAAMGSVMVTFELSLLRLRMSFLTTAAAHDPSTMGTAASHAVNIIGCLMSEYVYYVDCNIVRSDEHS